MISITQKSTFQKLYNSRYAYLFLMPLFINLIVFCYYPAFSGIYHSFFNWDANGTANFVGLKNFTDLFSDAMFVNSIPNMFKLMVPRLAISIIVPFIMAELIFFIASPKSQHFYRVACLLPMLAPGVVGTLVWKYVYDPSDGLAVAVGRLLGFIGKNQNIDWLGDPKLVIGSIIFMGFPWVGGTAVLIYLSGLMNIAGEIKEAALLDGASTLKRIYLIDIPLLMGQIRYFLIFGIIGGFQDYGVQIILTQGGPGFATYVPGYYMFKSAFTFGKMGYASAIGTMMFIAIFILTLLSLKFLKSKD